MRILRTLLGVLATAVAHGAVAQTSAAVVAIEAPAVVVSAPPAATERSVSRQATPNGSELLLFADTVETSRSLRIGGSRQLFIRSEVNPRWYRALYGGTQFFVRHNDVTLLEPSGPGRAGARKVSAKPKN